MMTMDDSLQLYVSLSDLGAVYRLEDVDRDGFAERMILFSADLDRPTGVAWLDGKLYVAEPAGIMTLTDPDRDGRADTSAVLLDSLPDDGGHWSRALSVFEQNLYLGIGSRCNACDESNPLRASVQKVNPVDAVMTGYATGLRQPLGLAWSPDGVLWSTDIGRTGQGAPILMRLTALLKPGITDGRTAMARMIKIRSWGIPTAVKIRWKAVSSCRPAQSQAVLPLVTGSMLQKSFGAVFTSLSTAPILKLELVSSGFPMRKSGLGPAEKNLFAVYAQMRRNGGSPGLSMPGRMETYM